MSTPSTPDATLLPLLSARRIVVCVGSGGVGKTTTSATLALLAAVVLGRRVLVLTIDPARRLADALGVRALGHDIQKVPDEKLEAVARHRGIPRAPGGSLSAMMLDQKRAFDEIVERYARDATVRRRIFDNGIYQQISARLAGSHEYAAMSKLYDLAQQSPPPYDLIVLDTPPTENALDFLDAPDRISQAIDSPALQWFIKPYLQAGSWSLRLVGVGGAFVLRGLSRFVGSTFLQQMAEFFVEFSEVTAGFRDRAEKVRTLLRKPDVAFVLVCSPEQLSIEEALYFHERLRRAEMPLGGAVVNRVHAAGPPLPAQFADQLHSQPALRGFVAEDLRHLTESLIRTYDEQQTLAASDQAAIGDLRRQVGVGRAAAGATTGSANGPASGPLPLCMVPMFDSDIHDAQGIARISEYLAPVPVPGPQN